MKTTTYLSLLLLLASLQSSAQNWLWGAKGETGLKADLYSEDVATNKTGNVYHAGAFETLLSFGNDTLKSSSQDAFLVKYDANGNVLWARQSVSPGGSTTCYSVATDQADNSYITGVTGTNTYFGHDTVFGNDNFFLVKYTPGGNVSWVSQSLGMFAGICVATDRFGHEFVTGSNSGTFLAKFDSSGKLLWNVKPAVCQSTTGYSVATDVSGNVYISGQFTDTLVFGTYTLISKKSVAVYVAKYDSNGNVLWAAQSTHNPPHPSGFNPNLSGITVTADKSGAAYVTGPFFDSITFGNYELHNPGSGYNIFLTKFDPAGKFLWAKQATPLDHGGWGTYSISSDTLNHIYLSGAPGQPGGPSYKMAFGSDTLSITGNGNDIPAILLKLDTAGNALCGSIIIGGGEYANSVASDGSGTYVYQAGGFTTYINFSGDTVTDNESGYDTFVARWKPCGVCGMVLKVTTGKVNGPEIGCDSTAMVTVSGGTPPYTYNWSPGGATTASVSGLCTGIYCCVVKDAGGCTDSTCVNIGAVGIETISSENGFNVYPVPTSGLLHIDIYDNSFTVNSIEVLDITGRTVLTQKINSSAHSLSINASVLEAGTYFLKLTSATGQKTARFVIIK